MLRFKYIKYEPQHLVSINVENERGAFWQLIIASRVQGERYARVNAGRV